MTVGTVNATEAPVAYSSSVTTYSFSFPVLQEEYVAVKTQNADGTETDLSFGVDYTVMLAAGDVPGGSVEIQSTLTNVNNLVVYRATTVEQTTALPNQGPFFAETVERMADRDTMVAQETRATLAIVPKYPEGTNVTRPFPPPREGYTIKGSSDGYIEGPSVSDIAAAQTYSEDAKQALDQFTDLYLGSKNSDPSVDNDGDPLQVGALFFNNQENLLKVWTGSAWVSNAYPNFPDGSQSVPGARFENDSDTGLYRPQDDDIRVVAGGAFGLNARKFSTDDTANIGVGLAAVAGNKMLIRAENSSTEDDGIGAVLQVQRYGRYDSGRTNPHALTARYIAEDGGDPNSKPWALVGVMDSSGTRFDEAGTAVSGVHFARGAQTGTAFGAHFQVKQFGDFTAAVVGEEINIQGAGTKTNHFGYDLIAKHINVESPEVSGVPVQYKPTAGMRIRGDGNATWQTGLLVEAGTTNLTMDVGVEVNNDTGGQVLGRGFVDKGSKAFGVDFQGSYAAAINLDGEKIRLGSRSGTSFELLYRYENSQDEVAFLRAGTEYVSLKIDGTPELRLNQTKVVGVQQGAISNSVGGDESAKINAILAALRAHGLIAT